MAHLAAIRKKRKKAKKKKVRKIEWPFDLESDEKEKDKKLTFVSISDTHLQESQLMMNAADFLILSGDFTNEGTVDEAKQVAKWIHSIRAKYRHIIIIAGNHEGYGDCKDPLLLKKILLTPALESAQGDGGADSDEKKSGKKGESETSETSETSEKIGKMGEIHFLHDESIELLGIRFHGTPWCQNPIDPHQTAEKLALRTDNGFHFNDDFIRDKYAQIPTNTDFLICHEAPKGVLDVNEKGSLELRKVFKRLTNLKVVQFGHVHSGRGAIFATRDSLGDEKRLLKEVKDKETCAYGEVCLCINASNDDGATVRNPQPVNQPMEFFLYAN